ncbi:MAG TPA: hypothetical protein VI488_01145 [Candidatus Angelobacter sp.]
MKQRIGLWALVGFAVACCWVIYGMVTAPNHNLGRWTVVALTVPASLLGRIVPLAVYWVVLLNAAAYALFGFSVELVRRHHL